MIIWKYSGLKIDLILGQKLRAGRDNQKHLCHTMSTKASSGNNIDAKREEFRKYLEKEGVLEYLTKQLVSK